MDAMENMLTRRSIRKFRPDPVPGEKLDRIIEAGLCAASGRNKQSSVIVAVTNKEIRDALSEENRRVGGWDEGFDPFYGAPVILAVLSDKEVPTAVYDGSCVMENLMLACHNEGLGSCWIHRAKQVFEMPEWKKFLRSLGIKGEYEGIGHCSVGYIDGEFPEPIPRRENRVFYAK